MMGTGEFPKDVCTKYILESVDNKIVVTSKVEGYIEPEKIIAEQFVYRENANATDV